MIWALAIVLATGTADPRIEINEAQVEARYEDALHQTETVLREQPELGRQMGLDYLRGHLLRHLGRFGLAHEAFAEALSNPKVSHYSRYWLARQQADDGHPEVASGLLATLLASKPPRSLAGPASRLLSESIAKGGDCRLLTDRSAWNLPRDDRRRLDIVHGECELRQGALEAASATFRRLLQEEKRDETARRAALRLAKHIPDTATRPDVARHVGMSLSQHREFDLAEIYLSIYLGDDDTRQSAAKAPGGGLHKQRYEAGYALARAHFWREQYAEAAQAFGSLLDGTHKAEINAKVLYQQGRSHELAGEWERAITSFARSESADPDGSWATAAILSALRIHWRVGNDEAALAAFAKLQAKQSRRSLMGRGALYLASSDLVRKRSDRAPAWLEAARVSGAAEPQELAYWQGRLHELTGDYGQAVNSYLRTLRTGGYGPFAAAASQRLRSDSIRNARRGTAVRLAQSNSPTRLHEAWLLLRGDPEEEAVAARLASTLRSSSRARRLLELRAVPVGDWPLWQQPIDQPEEFLIALGGWGPSVEGFQRHFPLSDVNLALTGGQVLVQRGAVRKGVYIAEVLAKSIPSDIPSPFLPAPFRRLLYPNPYHEIIDHEAGSRGVPSGLVSSIIREESRFDPQALSAASARGLTQFILPTARRLAPKIGKESIDAAELHQPPTSIALGAAYLDELLELFDGHLPAAVASYNAGERQAQLWQSYCFSKEPAEYVTKIGFPETRKYVRKVLTGKAHYDELYSPSEPFSAEAATTGGRSLASASQ